MRFDAAVKLGVNIDHVATLRQARKEDEPDPVAAARAAKAAGADLIVCHLRRDRRHIQDRDLFDLCRLKARTHIEISAAPAMVSVVLKAKPASVCLVPERTGEISTEGGLKLDGSAADVKSAVSRLKHAGIETSLFIDPSASQVRQAKKLGADTVELCTSSYATASGGSRAKLELEKLELAAYLADELGLCVHAGHGLDYHNVRPVAGIPRLQALNIGHAIVARSVFVGLREAVAEMKRLIA